MAIQNIPKVLAKAGLKKYGSRLKQYPLSVQSARKKALGRFVWLQPIVEEVWQELFPPPAPEEAEDTAAIAQTIDLPIMAGVQSFDSGYRRYLCEQKDPLRCDVPQAIGPDGQRRKHCQVCKFPTFLPEKAQLLGERGTYRIDSWIGRRGMGRLYAATQLGINQPVVIKEYLLPKLYFNDNERWQRRQTFKNLAGLSLADGRVQDFRFLKPIEAIVDDLEDRCYLVLEARNTCSTLNRHLAHVGSLSDLQVRTVLNQTLQTLEFLHGQKFRFPSGQVQTGLTHGGLSLDCLVIEKEQEDIFLQEVILEDSNQSSESSTQPSESGFDTDFFVYLCDLALWEHLFAPPLAKTLSGSIADDLYALGYVAFYLAVGKVISDTGVALEPRNDSHWPPIHPFTKQFILRLLGYDVPFESAEDARQELLRAPIIAIAAAFDDQPSPEAAPPGRRFPPGWIVLLSALGLGLLAWLIWTFLPKPEFSNAARLQLNAIKDVGGIPPGQFTYTAVQDGTWNYILQTPDLIQKGVTLEQKLKAAQPKLQLTYDPAVSTATAIARVQSGQAAFAIVPLLQPLPDSLEAQTIAYDGLAVFVPFSYSARDNGLPAQLKGSLTISELQQLYTDQVSNWKEIGGPRLSVNLYAPTNREAMEVFAQRILNKSQNQAGQDTAQLFDRTKQLPELAIMQAVLRDFEAQKAGGIGFGVFSRVVGQCSVYPLALQTPNNGSVQPIILSDGKAISPTTDLCSKKGSYHPNVEAFKTGRYPLAYPIVVVYSRDNDRPVVGQKFAEMLKTREGQRLLKITGLVPLE